MNYRWYPSSCQLVLAGLVAALVEMAWRDLEVRRICSFSFQLVNRKCKALGIDWDFTRCGLPSGEV